MPTAIPLSGIRKCVWKAKAEASYVYVYKEVPLPGNQTKEFEFTVPEGTLPVLLRDFSAPVKLKAPYSIENYQHMLSYCDDAFIKVDSAVSMQNMYIHEHVNEENEDCFKDPSQLIESYRTLLNNAVNSGDLLLINETLTIQSMQNMMETFDTIDIDGLSRARNVLEKKLAINLYKEYQDVYEKIKASKAAYSVDDMAKRAISNNALHMMALSLVSEGKSDAASHHILLLEKQRDRTVR